jgi:hypothetical protein
MKRDTYGTQMDPVEPRVTGVGPYDRQGPIRVGFGVYLISLILVALIIFIVMLVQYFPGYRSYYRIVDAVKNANYVYMGIRVPKEELKKRGVNPLTKEDDIAKILTDMGAKSAKCDINPDKVRIPHEP